MQFSFYSKASLIALAFLFGQPCLAVTEVVASQDISVRRGSTEPHVESKGLHAKKVKHKDKDERDRVVMLRFDSSAFGGKVGAAELRLQPLTFEKDMRMRFRVYAVRDGDQEDEKFEEDTYDPTADNAMIDTRLTTMLDRNQVAMLGVFTATADKPIRFSSDALNAFVRADQNSTVTLVIVRDTHGPQDSTFAPRQSKMPPTLAVSHRGN